MRLPIRFNRNHAFYFYCFRDVAGYLSKVADFDPPHLHLAPQQGVTPVQRRGLYEGKCKWSYGPSCPVDFPLNTYIHSFILRSKTRDFRYLALIFRCTKVGLRSVVDDRVRAN